MTGLALARSFYENLAAPAFKRDTPDLYGKLAFGLVGPGSECYGYDDETSRDHDWGPRVGVWSPDDLPQKELERLRTVYGKLPKRYLGYGPIERLDRTARRDGILPARRYFQQLIGFPEPPRRPLEWFAVPEWALSISVNGAVFEDNDGTVTTWRKSLMDYFPDAVRRKKLAVHLKRAGQAGQYNVYRTIQRGDVPVTFHQVALFLRESAALLHLIHGVFMPIEKWIYRSLRDLPGRSQTVSGLLEEIAAIFPTTIQINTTEALLAAINRTANEILREIRDAGWTDADVPFLYDCGLEIEASIGDESVRSVHDSRI